MTSALSSNLIIVVAREIASSNTWQWRHWSAYCTERDAWMSTLRARLIPRQPPVGKVRLRITSRRGRLIDLANLVAGAKPIPDCLKRLGYIRDDAPKWFECDYQQCNAPKGLRGTAIEWLTQAEGE